MVLSSSLFNLDDYIRKYLLKHPDILFNTAIKIILRYYTTPELILQLTEFKNSFIWKDLRRELIIWRKGFRSEVESTITNASESNLTSAAVLTHLGDLSGRIKAVEYFLRLPDILIQLLEDE